MVWPSAQDYQEAVQNPQINFSDPELQSGAPRLCKHGMPVVCSGRFATVYSLECAGRLIAVRCFLQNLPEQRARYKEIASYLETSNLPYTVPFELIERGILVNGAWYPIVKMQWVDGVSLIDYVAQHQSNQQKIARLASAWLQMIKRLRTFGIAHGDLQHGNVLIRNDQIVLVDYDGMFVPALSNLESNEIGHSNYQHPDRNNQHYGLYLDNFSAWVIHTALVCLALDPSILNRTLDRDEFLLFHKSDFKKSGSTEVLDNLRSHSVPQIRTVPDTLQRLLSLPVEELPWLEEIALSGLIVDKALEEHYKILGLSLHATYSQVNEACLVWQRVWDSKHYRHNKVLAKRAEQNLNAVREAQKKIGDALRQAGSA